MLRPKMLQYVTLKCCDRFKEIWLKIILIGSIVTRGDWIGSQANIKVTNKDAKIYVERSTTLHNPAQDNSFSGVILTLHDLIRSLELF